MRWALRPLSMVLAVLLVFAGGLLDLCACDAGSHGAFCAQAGSVTEMSCHAVAAPEPVDDCCAPAVVEGPSCCDAAAPVETGETVSSEGCGCPVIVLERSPSESPTTSSAAHLDPTRELSATPSLALLAGWIASNDDAPWPSVRAAEPRAPALRRHLELHVLRL